MSDHRSSSSWSGRATAGSIKLDVPDGLCLGGSGHPNSPSLGANDELEVNALVLDSDEGPVCIVSLDSLYVGEALNSTIKLDLADVIGPGRLLLFASHTHTAPAVDRRKPALGLVSPGWIDRLAEATVSLLRRCLKSPPQTVSCEWSAAEANHSVNRRLRRLVGVENRKVRFNAVSLSPNPLGPRDETVTVVVFRASNRPIAVVWNYACHPVSHPDPRRVSSHFPGVVRAHLRQCLGVPELPVLFLQGFSGDTRPGDPSVTRPSEHGLRRILLGPGFSPFTQRGYVAWSESLARVVTDRLLDPSPVTGHGVALHTEAVPLGDFVLGAEGRDFSTVGFAGLRVGNSLRLIGVGAEAMVEHADRIRGAFDGAVLPVGCMGDAFGYAPTRRMVAEGGYEGGGFCRAFGYGGLAPLAAQRFMESLDSAVRALGGVPPADEG